MYTIEFRGYYFFFFLFCCILYLYFVTCISYFYYIPSPTLFAQTEPRSCRSSFVFSASCPLAIFPAGGNHDSYLLSFSCLLKAISWFSGLSYSVLLQLIACRKFFIFLSLREIAAPLVYILLSSPSNLFLNGNQSFSQICYFAFSHIFSGWQPQIFCADSVENSLYKSFGAPR